MKGLIFDIKEFAVYDGPGIRTTVFMKGCPLRCRWCHNPEGLEMRPQLMVSVGACTRCGACKEHCTHEECVSCGECIPYCRAGLRRLCGEWTEPEELAARLLRDRSLWRSSGGGVTFSGGEPLLQWPFVRETAALLEGEHAAVETSGFAQREVFAEAMERMDLIIMDLKHMDSAQHERWTGRPNGLILENARMLLQGDTPCVIRVPLIPGVNDTKENLEQTARFLSGSKSLLRAELLPYHTTAGAKYEMAGMSYAPGFDTEREPNADLSAFERLGVPALVL
ncbi:MAG: glycyl-radical enzyme activating protein [Eubacteriales bacterium]|nr:glycyl-radical enzyme activating protein [Eubacteriales bacterium]